MDNPRAFPNTGNSTWGMQPTEGMTLRDWFAGQVLPFAASRSYGNDWGASGVEFPRLVAGFSYRLADAMLAARQEQGK